MMKNKDSNKFETPPTKIRKTLCVGNLPEETIKGLKESKMNERHTALNVLMQD